ncbi:hypothetical protein D9611_009161 [Ephemerocybe angulata]|uniref:Microtubule associated protein n=1 Tax=Ephemerocybe angulata TaxID=980116 RepID=A0A8H5CFJ2_9AGAR|nr:hypothetical protein D9611_009161 [Tulosesus angulatus]
MSTAETAILTTATTTAMTLTSLLNSLHTHLQTQTQLLPTLHAQLGLPATALEDELKVLQDQLIEGVERQIDLRRKQVDEWMEKCEGVESVCISYTKALGGNVKATGSSLGEIRKEQSLPRRYELVTEFQEKLRQAYHTKLEQLTTLTSRLNALARTLGTEYFSPDVLDATPAIDEPASDSAAPRDVTPERFLKLEKELVRGKAEVTKRLHQLSSIFVQIDWLYTELGIPIPSPDDELDPSSSQRHMATDSSDPFCVSTPTPASRTTTTVPLLFQNNTEVEYQRTFNAFIARIEELDGQEPPESHIPVGLEGVEPSQGIIEWAAAQQASLEELKRQREAHIQSMYDQLEGLWRRLGVDEAAMDSFVDMHRGSTEETVREYEEELERMLELKQESMAQFVQSAREEVVKLWDDLMIGEEERADFAPFADAEMTEELLSIHEGEIRRLKEERRMKAPLLASIKKYFVICDEEKELQASASDQTRLLGRGRDPGRLLREEKMRKRVQKEKPRLEQDLLAAIPSWELETGKPFLVHGESILQLLHETVAAQEQESLKRKATRGGSASARATTPTAPSSNGYVPGGGTKRAGTVTPAVRPRSAMASSSKTVPNKRQKLGDSTSSTTSNSTSHPSTSNSTGQRVPLSSHRGNSGGRGPAARAGSPPASKRPKTPGVPSSTSRPGGSNIAMPTARHASGPSSVRQGNAFGSGRAASHGGAPPASVGASARRFQSAGAATHGVYTQGQGRAGPGAVAKAARASRESFKPRPSIDHLEMKEMKRSVGGGTRYGGVGVGPAVDEEEED